jgi:hypothetical protein
MKKLTCFGNLDEKRSSIQNTTAFTSVTNVRQTVSFLTLVLLLVDELYAIQVQVYPSLPLCYTFPWNRPSSRISRRKTAVQRL